MSRSVIRNWCAHCWQAFDVACLWGVRLCRRCAQAGHVEERWGDCPRCLEEET